MLNINEKLLEQLNESEYFLLCIIAKYGKKSCPKNTVLCSKTKWGINKVQKTKKALIAKELLISSVRWKKLDGKFVRDSNEYLINTKLIGKYNGKKSELSRFDVVEIHVDENEVLQIDVDETELDENNLGIKVLKVLIIESIKVLKEKSVLDAHTQIKELKLEVKNLLKIKNQKSFAKKGNATTEEEEKEKRIFPDNTPKRSYTVPKTEQQQTKPYEIFLNNYPFNGWSEKLKENFILYCEVKNDYNNGRYSSTQIKMRIAEIVAGIDKHEMIWLEKLVLAAANGSNGGWASFEFDTRIKERKEKKQKDENKQQANNGKSMFENYADSLSDNWSEDENGTVDTTWEEM